MDTAPILQFVKHRYHAELQQMLFTFGDVRTPLADTVALVEDLAHAYVTELIRSSALTAQARQSKSLTTEDICFQFRHLSPMLVKLRDYLSWRDVRKNVKNAPTAPTASVSASVINVTTMPPTTSLDDTLLLDLSNETPRGTGGPEVPEAISPSPSLVGTARRPLRFSWEDSYNLFLDLVPEELFALYEDLPVNPLTCQLDRLDYPTDDDGGAKGEGAEEEERAFFETATRGMSAEEYLEYSECRQASFTFKKGKKFRDWITPASLTDYRLSDECLELCGLAAWEFCRVITRRALSLQRQCFESPASIVDRKSSLPDTNVDGNSPLDAKQMGPFRTTSSPSSMSPAEAKSTKSALLMHRPLTPMFVELAYAQHTRRTHQDVLLFRSLLSPRPMT